MDLYSRRLHSAAALLISGSRARSGSSEHDCWSNWLASWQQFLESFQRLDLCASLVKFLMDFSYPLGSNLKTASKSVRRSDFKCAALPQTKYGITTHLDAHTNQNHKAL